MSANIERLSHTYGQIEKALHFIESHFHEQPTLQDIARSAHMSEFHFQRVFSNWVGISPKRFLQFLTKEHAKKLLRESRNLLDVTFESGLSSPGRLHDLFVSCEAMTPGDYKQEGSRLKIVYGFHPTPFGECMLALTDLGICGLDFIQAGGRDFEMAELRRRWEKAEFVEDPERTGVMAAKLFRPQPCTPAAPFHVLLKGTNFQIKVWEALLRIPYGHLVSYADIASYIGKPKSVRAVANAIGNNPVPFLIPCHRVIRKLGLWGGYGEGPARKIAIIGWEAANRERKHSVKPAAGIGLNSLV